MMGVSKGAVWTAAVVMLGAAGVGSYLGYSRALAAPGSQDPDAYAATTPLAAKKATSVDATAPPPVDEAYIRKIAHDEAVAVVHPPQAAGPKKVRVVQASDDSDDDDDDKSSGANPPTPPTVAGPAPVAVPKPPPPPTGLY
ncbi:hypothetical protein [Caulobacter sp. S45]|uniref:hypothetical protein n=1 Tax=Caulobacter sp. S45 TaxID=1641861 RepID=UPI001C2CCF1E|nr:hypothetical protein [Caulobacter sp. S45]